MSGLKLPPSPWYVDPDDRPDMEWNNHVLSDDGNTVCFMAHDPDGNEALENAARLIAAAPALYEALEGMLGLVQLLMARPEWSDNARHVVESNHRIAAARAALSSASAQKE